MHSDCDRWSWAWKSGRGYDRGNDDSYATTYDRLRLVVGWWNCGVPKASLSWEQCGSACG